MSEKVGPHRPGEKARAAAPKKRRRELQTMNFDEYMYIDPENCACRSMRRPRPVFVLQDIRRARDERAASLSFDRTNDVFSSARVER